MGALAPDVADHPVGRAAQGRLRDLQQAQAQPVAARDSADPDFVGGDAGDVRAAQEAQVARRRVPAEAARRRGAPGQGEPAWCPWARRWTPTRSTRPTRATSSSATTRTSRSAAPRPARRRVDEARTSPPRSRRQRQDLEPALAERTRRTRRQQTVLEPPESPELSPFQGETFDSETQAAFAALEAGAHEGTAKPAPDGGDMVDLRIALERRGPAAVPRVGGAAQDHRARQADHEVVPAEHGWTRSRRHRAGRRRDEETTRSPRRSCR